MGRWLKYGLIGCGALSVLGVLLIGFVVAVALLTSSGGSTADSGGQDAPDGPPAITCETGEPCELGESTVTVTKADETNLVPTRYGDYKGNFVLIEFEYTYDGERPATVEYSWQLEDGEGRIYNFSDEATDDYAITEDRSLRAQEMNPGTERPGAIVFEVSPDAKNFTLHIEDFMRPAANKKANVPL